MKLSEIKKMNQDIYEINSGITRENKLIFIATLVFDVCLYKDFRNVANLTKFIEFYKKDEKGNDPQPVDQLIDMAIEGVQTLHLQKKTENSVITCLNRIRGVTTGLNEHRDELKKYIESFIAYYPSIKPEDPFFETLYMEIDKKSKSHNEGEVLTPNFIAMLMIDLADLDYKTDVLADLCAGTGLFSILGYSKMLNDLNADRENGEINRDDYNMYRKRLLKSIIANDNDSKMITVCLANFLLKSFDTSLLSNEDVLLLEKSSFKTADGEYIQPTKAILNPPYESPKKPLEILLKNIELVKDGESHGHKVIAILPPQLFGQKKSVFADILAISTLTCVISTQEHLFVESGNNAKASIFVFDTTKPQSKDDIIRYFDFSDSGYAYYKDSGLVDKSNTFREKEKSLLDKIRSVPSQERIDKVFNSDERNWLNFYEIEKDPEIMAKVNPDRVKTSNEESDISIENVCIRKAQREKQRLIDQVNNNFVDEDGDFEKYIINILSEEN